MSENLAPLPIAMEGMALRVTGRLRGRHSLLGKNQKTVSKLGAQRAVDPEKEVAY